MDQPDVLYYVRVGVDIGVPVGGYYYGEPILLWAPYYYGNLYYPDVVAFFLHQAISRLLSMGQLIMLTMGRIIFTPNMAIRRCSAGCGSWPCCSSNAVATSFRRCWHGGFDYC